MPTGHYDRKPIERFWSKVNKTDTCWLWTGCCDAFGHGVIGINCKQSFVHRVSWVLAGNIIPDGHVVRHKCRSKNCVNPEHLETGTQAENAADMIRDGTSAKGVKNPSCKLTEEQVRQIRASTESGAFLAKKFGVSQPTICNIRAGKRWSWLTAV